MKDDGAEELGSGDREKMRGCESEVRTGEAEGRPSDPQASLQCVGVSGWTDAT